MKETAAAKKAARAVSAGEEAEPAAQPPVYDDEVTAAATSLFFRRHRRRCCRPSLLRCHDTAQLCRCDKQDTYDLVVCHGNVIRYFTLRALQLPPGRWLKLATYNCGCVRCLPPS